MSAADAGIVLAAGLLAAVAMGLGTLVLLFVRRAGAGVLGLANAVASGVMLSVGLVLVREGVRDGGAATAAGCASGVVLVLAARRLLPERLLEPAWMQGPDSRRPLLVIAVMAAHSLAEGIALGSSFGAGEARGIVTGAALAAHKLAEGLAIGLVLVPRGAGVRTAAAWSVASALPEPLVALPAFAAVAAFAPGLPLVLGLAAGAMATVAGSELLPEACSHARIRTVLAAVAATAVLATALQLALA